MKNTFLPFIALLLFTYSCSTSKKIPNISTPIQSTIVFYNVENLFDTIDAAGKTDEEFTPGSAKKWNTPKYLKKLNSLAVVFDSIGKGQLPDLIAMEEVENRTVLEDLAKEPLLADANYQIIHYESPDFRGIDNALLYNPKAFKPLYQRAIPIHFPDSIGKSIADEKTTRDILYVKGILHNTDTLHIFVNHWTSMYNGRVETIPFRAWCAVVLKNSIDSIFAINPQANIIAGGDFNEDVFGPAINGVLQPDSSQYENFIPGKLYDLAHYLFTRKKQGSYEYKGVWGSLDHIIVSGNLLNSSNLISTTKDMAGVLNSDFLMHHYNNQYGKGIRPNRTYGGDNYYGGFSDHLPVYLQLKIKKSK